MRNYLRDEKRFERFGKLELSEESVENILCQCEELGQNLTDQVHRLRHTFVDMSEGFTRRLNTLHTKLKRLK